MSNTDLQLVRAQLHHRNRYQCPWSKCFPHMYTDSKQPCAKSSFKDFSKLDEHIRRYHSHKDLSSERPVSQFANVKWTEEEQTELEEEANGAGSGKRQKEEKQPKSSKGNSKRQKKEIPPESQPFFHMMTREQGDKFRAWQDRPDIKRMRDKEEKYWSLCRLLFEYEDDNMFNDLTSEYDFLVPKHSICPSLVELGERNLRDLEARIVQLPDGLAQNLQADALTLDGADVAGRKPSDWSLQVGTRTNDSGYVSVPTNPTPGNQVVLPLGCESETSNLNPTKSEDDLSYYFGVLDNSPDSISGTNPGYAYPPYIDESLNADYEDTTGAPG